MKKIVSLILIVMLALSFAACGGGSQPSGAGKQETEKDPYEGLTKYETASGMTLYMEAGLSEDTIDGFDAYLAGDYCAMTAIIEGPEIFDAAGIDFGISLEEYSTYIVQANSLETDFARDNYDNLYVEYEKTIDGTDFYYYCVVKKFDKAFCAVTFMSVASDKAEYSKEFPLWASSIDFK